MPRRTYDQTVNALDDQGKPMVCLAAKDDQEAFPASALASRRVIAIIQM
ncbi:MAG TPA: hypothetical protein VII92_11855 [Anaerolineae bacterium]